jgi:hypothetical protein
MVTGSGYDPTLQPSVHHNGPKLLVVGQADAAYAELIAMLDEQPGAFWPTQHMTPMLHQRLEAATLHSLLHRTVTEGRAALLEQRRIWCSVSAADAWPAFKKRVAALVSGDAFVTLAELSQAMPDVAKVSIQSALLVLIANGEVVAAAGATNTWETCGFIQPQPGRDERVATELGISVERLHQAQIAADADPYVELWQRKFPAETLAA